MATPLDPVLGSITRDEVISDPALRELYFGSTDTPGLINQATRAAQKSYLDQPAILQGTAGLSAQEQQARQLAQQGIGSYQPFLDRQESLIGQGISDLGTQRGLLDESLGGYRAAYGMQQPYFGQAEQQLGSGLTGLFGSLGYGGPSARQLLGQSLQGYDPRMAGQFYNPFEQQVVDQTIQDVLKAGEMQDIKQRASDISRGGESAFGSRARLTAQERQESLGRGLGDVLSKIRSGGFNTAQDRALQELENRRSAAQRGSQLEAGFGKQGSDAQRQYAQDLLGLGQNRSSAARQLAGDISGVGTGIAGIGSQLAGYGSDLGALGATQQRLREEDIGTLTSLGATERSLEQARLDNLYNQQQATRDAPLKAAQFIQGFAPQYRGSQTMINKQYGMPRDPMREGLAAAFNTYSQFQGGNQGQPQGQGQGQSQGSQPQQPQQPQPAQDYTLMPGGQSYGPETFNQYDPSTEAGQNQILSGGVFTPPASTGQIDTFAAFNQGSYLPPIPGYTPPQNQATGPVFNYQPQVNPGFNQSAIQNAFNQGSYGSTYGVTPPPINIGGSMPNPYDPFAPNPYKPGQINYTPRG